MRAGIIAAGWGRRLGGGPKALTKVGGVPLVDHVLRGLLEAGVDRVTCIVNEASTSVCDHVGEAWPALPVEWIVRTTPTSMHSFLLVLEALAAGGDEACLLTTIDSVSAPGTVARFVEEARRLPAALALGVTDVIDDEKPLYVVPAGAIGEARGPFRLAALSSEPASGRYVTAGFYWAAPAILAEKPHALAQGYTALRQFLGRVVSAGHPAWAVPLPPVIDVDRPEDVAAAEQLAGRAAGTKSGRR